MNVKILIGLFTVIIISLLLPSYKNIETDFEVGTIWSSEDLIAPFSFPIYRDDVEYERDKKEVTNNVTPVFIELNYDSEKLKDSLSIFFAKAEELFQKATISEKNNEGGIYSDKLDKLKESTGISLNNEEWNRLFKFSKNEFRANNSTYQNFKLFLRQTISEYSDVKIINLPKNDVHTKEISIKKNNEKFQRLENLDKVYEISEVNNLVKNKFETNLKDSSLSYIALIITGPFIKVNLLFSKELTDLEIQNRLEQIPKTTGIVRENERIISKHDPITKMTKLKLDSFKKVRLENTGVQDYFTQTLGKVLTILILFVVLTLFLFYIRNNIFQSNIKLALISSLIILVNFIAFLSLKITVNAPVELLIFISVASILLTIIFDSRLAFFTIVIICLLVAAIRGGDYNVAFISFSGSVLAIFSVRDIKNRSQIFRSFFFVLLGYAVSILAVGLDRSESLQKLLVNLLFGSINSIMSPVIAYGLLIFYEKVFGIATDLTLIELADFNQPLLKKLSTNAPGTFHHSIVMGNLAEEAAASIGANRVLARVGCYYHDIGKVAQPNYFVENQMERINKHEELNPNISAKIIIAHVKDGIELAKQYKLPQEIINFIPMHHGTTLVSYFYSKAKDMSEGESDDLLDYIYRYPGPKPQTKETGIAMLADTVEASTKAIENPSAKKLEDKIDSIIKKRFMEGELDECDLTLKDLTKIKKSFLKILIGIHHQRIKYPEELISS